MIIRSALLLAALTLPSVPAPAQDSTEEAPPAAEAPAPAEESPAEAPPPSADIAAEPAAAPDAAPPLAPAPAAVAALAGPPAPPPPSPFTPDQRSNWLAQCRVTFQRAGAPLGGANGLPDACDKQLLDFERTYVPQPDGRPPVIYVRVPITRAAPAAPDAVDADVEPDAGAATEE